ncbi:MAG: hypothetical protein DME22_16655 [Verrucomicrobia bacterium]|nr:MAG: hypothetical protein DME22_16655 [Verrucomicrobiota bacterium]
MGETSTADSAEVRAAAAAAVAPDALTAEILAKHAVGEKLTHKEGGHLGVWKKKLQGIFGGKGDAAPGPAVPAASPGHAPGVAALVPAQAPDCSLAAVPIDAGLVQRTTNAVLTRCESIARRYVGTAAREAGVTGETLARFDRAACLPKDDRALMVELSPDVFAALGLDPRHYPVMVFAGCFGLWATDLWLAVQDLKAMKEERNKSNEPAQHRAVKPTANGEKA